MSSGDAAAVEAFYSLHRLGVFIGTDAAEFWTDSGQHNADVRRYFDGSGGVNRWTPGDVIARMEGSVGWTIDRPTVELADGTRYEGLRVTLVWHLEDGDWRIVHSHASVGG